MQETIYGIPAMCAEPEVPFKCQVPLHDIYGRSIKEEKNIKLMIFLLEKSETAWDLRMGAKEIDSGISQIALLNATIVAFSRLVYEMK